MANYSNKKKQKILQNKVIDVKVEQSKGKFSCKGCEILNQGKNGIKIEVDTKKNSIKNVIDHLLKKYEVLDINIQDPPIEEVIEIVYKMKNAKEI